MKHVELATFIYFVFFVLVIQCAVNTPITKDLYSNAVSGNNKKVPVNAEEITIVNTVDGNIHGIDQTGNRLWTTSTGGPMVGAHNFETVLPDDTSVTVGAGQRTDLLGAPAPSTRRKNYAVLPGTDGSIVYHSLEGMRKTSVSARLLAEQAPFISKEGLAFSGSKRSRLMSFDVNSGELLFDTDATEQTSAMLRSRQQALASADKQSCPLWFGRVDYSVRAIDTLTGLEEFNITYSELHPLPYGNGGDGMCVSDPEANAADTEEMRISDGYKQRLDLTAAQDDDCDSGDDLQTADKALQSVKSLEVKARKPGLKGGSRKARRKRKSRVRMERRAGIQEELYTAVAASSPAAVGGSAHSPAVSLISTPDGELYFSDLDGTVIEKVPASLQSPVIKAFKLKRPLQHEPVEQQQAAAMNGQQQHALPAPQSFPNAARLTRSGVAWDIRSVNVHHRILTYAPTGAIAMSTGETGGQPALAAPYRDRPDASIVVQSSAPHSVGQGEGGASLYVLEVTDLEMPSAHWESAASYGDGSSDGSQRFLPQPGALPMISSPPPASIATTAARPDRKRGSGGHFTKRELLASMEERRRLGLLGSVRGSDKLLHGKNSAVDRSAYVRGQNGASLSSGGGLSAPEITDADSDAIVVTSTGGGVCAARHDGASFLGVGADAACALTASDGYMIPEEEARLMSDLRSSIAEAESAAAAIAEEALTLHPPVPPSMRGPHKLRSTLYDGELFSPDERMNLFGGVLPATLHQVGQQRSEADVSYDASSTARDNSRVPGVAEPVTRLVRLERFVSKVLAIVEVVVLYLTAVLIVLSMMFVAAVYVVRITPALCHLLPEQGSFVGQLQYASQVLIGRIVDLLVSAVSAPPPVPPAPAYAEPASSRAHPIPIAALSLPSRQPEVPTVSDGSATPAPTPDSNAASSIKESPGSIVTPVVPSAVPSAPVESLDADGRRLVHVGSLVVHSECVLGYGSHGTVVYKGSLHGRPLAVKRILSQFVRSADREISLLIRSDGHPNVVRYYTKEVQNDFVYLGLQLCDMTLKDFILNVKSKRSPRTAAAIKGMDKDEEQGASVSDSTITEELKSSLLQIAHGLAHLHSQRIVHRDIKPHNILCAGPRDPLTGETNEGGGLGPESSDSSLDDLSSYVLKISDMGLSKQLGRENFSFSSMSLSMAAMSSTVLDDRAFLSCRASAGDHASEHARAAAAMMQAAAVGTVGWQAPELISHRYANRSDAVSADTFDLSSELAEVVEAATPSSGDAAVAEEDEAGESDGEDEGEGEGDAADRGGSADAQTGPVGTGTSLKRPPIPLQRAKQLRDRKKRTLTVDVFSLGCVFYFTITLGEHPYGEWFEREANIAAGKVDLALVQHDLLAVDLISWMLHADPLLRPSSKEVCQHAFFWSPAKKLDFLVEFSDRLEQELPDSVLVLALEAGAQEVIGSRWDRRLDVLLLEDLGKYRKYDTSSVRDLLRVMRNKRHHFHELSAELKQAMGVIPTGFLSYFEARFPRLVLHCAQVANAYLSAEQLFKQWAACTSSTFRPKRSAPSCSTSERIAPEPLDSIRADSGDVGLRVSEVVVWQGSALATSLQYSGWWRSGVDWVAGSEAGAGAEGGGKKTRPSHLSKAAADPKYRTKLCSHWESSQASNCPMRKKGKCIFAHGPLELRVRENRRDKWCTSRSPATSGESALLLVLSGGEDVLGAARCADRSKPGTDNTADEGFDAEAPTPGPSASPGGNKVHAQQTSSAGNLGPVRGSSAGIGGSGTTAGQGQGSGPGGRGGRGRPAAPYAGATVPAGYYAQQQAHMHSQYPAAQFGVTQQGMQQYPVGGMQGNGPTAAQYYYQQQQVQQQQYHLQQQAQHYHNPYNAGAAHAGANYQQDDPSKPSGAVFYSYP